MFDPATISLAVGGAKAAIAGVRELVDLYKQAKATGSDVGGIIGEVTGLCGKFFSHSEAVNVAEEKKAAELKANPKARLKSLNEQALENVSRRREVYQMEVELREMIVYHLGQPGLWDEFCKERERLRKERAEAEAELAALERRKAAERRRRMARIEHAVSRWIAIVIVVVVFCTLMYGLRLDAQARREEEFERAEFERRWVTDPKVIDCWKVVQGTGVLPRFCMKDPE